MKKGLATIWVVLITVIVMAGLAAGGWYYIDKQQNTDQAALNKQIDDLQSQVTKLQKDAASSKSTASTTTTTTNSTNGSSSAATTTADPYLYTNSTYGFSLQFNSKWQGYRMMPATISGSTATYYVTMPTTDANYQKATSTAYAGTVSLYAISVFTQSQWATATAEEGPQPTKIGDAGNWVIAYSGAQDSPQEATIIAAGKDFKNVIATFKAL